MDNLWSRRSNTNSKLSLTTSSLGASNSGSTSHNDHPTRNYSFQKRNGGDTPSHGGKANPFNLNSPAVSSVASPTSASNAFGLGSGAFASFGASKTPKSPGNALDFSSAVGAKTPTAEKNAKDLSTGATRTVGAKASSTSITTNNDAKSISTASTGPEKHPLKHAWAFWYRPPISKTNGFVDYEKTLHAIAGFDTVEDFFRVYRYLKRPSSLPLVSDYHIFKKGVRPVWEDEENKRGGKWIVRLKKGVADRYWEDLLLAIVGDQFADASDEVCGAVLSVRNGEDILSIWTRNDGGRVLKIRETMKRVLAFPPDTKVEWKSHDSSIAQRAAIDESRKEKPHNANHHSEKQQRSGAGVHKEETHPGEKQR